jgi:hypothetical protein
LRSRPPDKEIANEIINAGGKILDAATNDWQHSEIDAEDNVKGEKG